MVYAWHYIVCFFLPAAAKVILLEHATSPPGAARHLSPATVGAYLWYMRSLLMPIIAFTFHTVGYYNGRAYFNRFRWKSGPQGQDATATLLLYCQGITAEHCERQRPRWREHNGQHGGGWQYHFRCASLSKMNSTALVIPFPAPGHSNQDIEKVFTDMHDLHNPSMQILLLPVTIRFAFSLFFRCPRGQQ